MAVAGLVTLARRLRIPYPVLLLLGGLALGAISGVPRLEVAPDSVLLLVLPPIVYVAAFFTPIRSFRADLGHIASLAVGLVLASTAAAAGVALGLVVGWLIAHVRSRLADLPVEITVSLLTPYAAYLPAELFGVSGVLAAVTAGLYLGRRASRIMGSDVRLAGRAVWEMLIFLLNG